MRLPGSGTTWDVELVLGQLALNWILPGKTIGAFTMEWDEKNCSALGTPWSTSAGERCVTVQQSQLQALDAYGNKTHVARWATTHTATGTEKLLPARPAGGLGRRNPSSDPNAQELGHPRIRSKPAVTTPSTYC